MPVRLTPLALAAALPPVLASLLAVAACSQPPAKAPAEPSADQATPAAGSTRTAEQARNLANFDDLDFNVYSKQKWSEIGRSHASNILVHYPDGRTTTGIEQHLTELKPQFAFAPNTRITAHPLKLADGPYTVVQGVMEGTFTQPMVLPDGKVIQPTNKSFNLPMLTVARWENGLMVEEWLYWDNQAFMKQIGLAP